MRDQTNSFDFRETIPIISERLVDRVNPKGRDAL